MILPKNFVGSSANWRFKSWWKNFVIGSDCEKCGFFFENVVVSSDVLGRVSTHAAVEYVECLDELVELLECRYSKRVVSSF